MDQRYSTLPSTGEEVTDAGLFIEAARFGLFANAAYLADEKATTDIALLTNLRFSLQPQLEMTDNRHLRVGLSYLQLGLFHLRLVFVAYSNLVWSVLFYLQLKNLIWFGLFLLTVEVRFGRKALRSAVIREEKQHKHKLFGPDFLRMFLTLTPGCPGVKKFLPGTGAAGKRTFWCGRPQFSART